MNRRLAAGDASGVPPEALEDRLEHGAAGRVVDALAPMPRCLGSDEIRALLPHSWPFLFLDRVTDLQPPRLGVGLKNVSVSEPYFAGHFPQASVMPGVLIVEALAQLAGIVVAAASSQGAQPAVGGNGVPGVAYLVEIRRMRFRHPVRPGDQVELRVERCGAAGSVAEYSASARVDGLKVAEGSLVLCV